MKKRIIILTLVLIIGIISYVLYNNRIVSTITLDINPSIEINLTKKGKVKSVVALNNDAKNIVTDNFKNKTLDDVLNLISDNLINSGYIEDNQVIILLYSTGNIDNGEVQDKIRNTLGEKQVAADVIVVENITKEDQALAQKYNISPAKAYYINQITKENNMDIENLVNRQVKELKDTKETGNYCDEEYVLEGDFCFKEIERKPAKNGMVCERGYYDYNGNCYEQTDSIEQDKFLCTEPFTLNGTKCTRKIIIEAEPSKYMCNIGEAKTRLELGLTNSDAGDANDIVCVDTSSATHPVSPCELNDGTEYTISGGTCYWHRAPVIEEGCPGKIQVDGMCWDDASNILICWGARDGRKYNSRDEYCENTIKYYDPVITEYKCPEGHTLNGNKCEKEEIEDARRERTCPSGYTLVDNDRCINYNKKVSKQNGYICDEENSKIKDNTCIIYDIVEAHHKER